MPVSFRVRSLARPLLLASLVSSLALSCSSEPKEGAGVVLVMRTDMKVPEGVRSVGVYITRIETDGRARSVFSQRYETTETPDGNKVSLPGRLALQNTTDDGVRVHVRVIAFDASDRATTMREARMQLPTDSVRALALPLLWMNTGEVVDNGESAGGEDAIGRFGVRSCPDGQGLNDMGTCQSIEIDARGLPEYDEKNGTGDEGDAGACDPDCFDVAQCFRAESEEGSNWNFRALRARIGWFDETKEQCGIPFNKDLAPMAQNYVDRKRLSDALAVAVRVPPEEGAFCNPAAPNECYVPLDRAAFAGFGEKMLQSNGDGNVWALLPPGVCRKWAGNDTLTNADVIAAPRCPRKREDQRICTSARPACEKVKGVGWNNDPEPEADGGTAACAFVERATGLFAADGSLVVGTFDPLAYRISGIENFREDGCLTAAPELFYNSTGDDMAEGVALVDVGMGLNRLGGMPVGRTTTVNYTPNNDLSWFGDNGGIVSTCGRWTVGPRPSISGDPIVISNEGALASVPYPSACPSRSIDVTPGRLSNGIRINAGEKILTVFARNPGEDSPFLECYEEEEYGEVWCNPGEGFVPQEVPGLVQAAVGNSAEDVYVLYNDVDESAATIIHWKRTDGGWVNGMLARIEEPVSPLMQLTMDSQNVYIATLKGKIYALPKLRLDPVTTYHEQPDRSIFSLTLGNGYLYWLDRAPDDFDTNRQTILRRRKL